MLYLTIFNSPSRLERFYNGSTAPPGPRILQRGSFRVLLFGFTRILIITIFDRLKISYTILSLTFIFNFLGFLLAAIANVALITKYGFGVVRSVP